MLAHTVAINLQHLLVVKILVEDQIRIVVQMGQFCFILSIYINKNYSHDLQQIE